jgi:hypothetical protein
LQSNTELLDWLEDNIHGALVLVSSNAFDYVGITIESEPRHLDGRGSIWMFGVYSEALLFEMRWNEGA